MAKITRKTLLQFGSTVNAGTEIGQFGSYAAPVYSADPAVIQAGTAWPRGWVAETIATNRPFLEDFNATDFMWSYFLCYLLEMGMAEYDAATVYYQNSYVQVTGAIYRSKTDANTGNTPSSSPTQWDACIDLVTGGAVVGEMKPYAGTTAPTGYLMCDGTAVSRATYANLFAICGTTYGSGDGLTTFNVPDARGNTLVGRKAADGSFGTLGGVVGEKTHTLIVSEMPSHTHDISTMKSFDQGFITANTNNSGFAQTYQTGSKGGDGAHNNIQPSLVINYIIKT